MERKCEAKSPHVIYYYRQENIKKQTFYNIRERKSEERSIKEMENTKCAPTWTGWMVVMHPHGQCYLLDPLSMSKINLPPFKRKIQHTFACALSHPPDNPNCTILMTIDVVKKFFFLCKPGDKTWFKYSYKDKDITLLDTVSCNGVFYGVTSQDELVVIDGYDFRNFKINILEQIPNVMGLAGLGSSRTYLVESDGDMFVLDRYFMDRNTDDTYMICIKKRDELSSEWKEVDEIGDRVFFLGHPDGAHSCSASDIGLKKNCVYFVKIEDPRIYFYDLEEGSISVQIPAPTLSSDCLTPIWLMPRAGPENGLPILL